MLDYGRVETKQKQPFAIRNLVTGMEVKKMSAIIKELLQNQAKHPVTGQFYCSKSTPVSRVVLITMATKLFRPTAQM